MGLDWERLSLSGYFEALEAHNEASDPNAAKSKAQAGDLDRLKRAMQATGNW